MGWNFSKKNPPSNVFVYVDSHVLQFSSSAQVFLPSPSGIDERLVWTRNFTMNSGLSVPDGLYPSPVKIGGKKTFVIDLRREVTDGFDSLVHDPRAGDWSTTGRHCQRNDSLGDIEGE